MGKNPPNSDAKAINYHQPTKYPASPQAMANLEKLPPPVLFLTIMLYGTEYPFGQFASAVLTTFPPSLLSTPNLLAHARRVRNREHLDNVYALFSNS